MCPSAGPTGFPSVLFVDESLSLVGGERGEVGRGGLFFVGSVLRRVTSLLSSDGV